jgi:two-component system, probable response regulator PhcQ
MSLPNGSHIFLNARSADEQELEIEVSDDGPGLPREALRSVFDPFFLMTDKHQELGINLMACYFLVYHLDGRVDAQSQDSQGATFKLTFPRRPKAPSTAKDEEAFLAKVLMNDALWERLMTGY